MGSVPWDRAAGGNPEITRQVFRKIQIPVIAWAGPDRRIQVAQGRLVVAVGLGAIKFLHKDLATTVMHWVQVLRVDPDNRFVRRIIARIFRVTPRQLRELSAGTFLYAGLFTTEGLGLLIRKRWAEYFTIVTTGGLIPLEIFQLSRHFTIAKTVSAPVNILIV